MFVIAALIANATQSIRIRVTALAAKRWFEVKTKGKK